MKINLPGNRKPYSAPVFKDLDSPAILILENIGM